MPWQPIPEFQKDVKSISLSTYDFAIDKLALFQKDVKSISLSTPLSRITFIAEFQKDVIKYT